MYLGSNSFSRFVSFLNGWFFDGEIVQYDSKFNDFEDWLVEEYRLQALKDKPSWHKIISLYSIGDNESLDRFFELFGAFEAKRKERSKAVISS